MEHLSKESREKAKLAKDLELSEYMNSLVDGTREQRHFLQLLKNCPPTYKFKYMKALKGELGRAECSKLRCIECSGWSRNESKLCTVTACPMWHYRPK